MSVRLCEWLDGLQSHGFDSCSLRQTGDSEQPEAVEHSNGCMPLRAKRTEVPLNTRVLSIMNGWLWAGDGVKHDGIVSESGDYWHVVAVSG